MFELSVRNRIRGYIRIDREIYVKGSDRKLNIGYHVMVCVSLSAFREFRNYLLFYPLNSDRLTKLRTVR